MNNAQPRKSINSYAIGERIYRFRKLQGMTQAQLAKRIGISASHMSRMETGSKAVSVATLVALSEALHVRVDDLLRDTEDTTLSTEALQIIQELLTDCTESQILFLLDLLRVTKSIFSELPIEKRF